MLNAMTSRKDTKSCSSHSIEKKATASSFSSITADGFFEGYACLFDKADLGGDVIRKGAFTKSLQQRGQTGIKLLYQHDPNQPVGQWLNIREDEKGLFVQGQLATGVEKAREIHTMMKAGILDGLSIGFRTVIGRKDSQSGLRHLIELDLWEISIVTFPMQPDARISSVKSITDQDVPLTTSLSKRELERKLMHDAGLSRSQARALMAYGHSGLSGMQDAARSGPSSDLAALRSLTRTIDRATRSLSD